MISQSTKQSAFTLSKQSSFTLSKPSDFTLYRMVCFHSLQSDFTLSNQSDFTLYKTVLLSHSQNNPISHSTERSAFRLSKETAEFHACSPSVPPSATSALELRPQAKNGNTEESLNKKHTHPKKPNLRVFADDECIPPFHVRHFSFLL